MSIRFDVSRPRIGIRAAVTCPACGKELESAGLARPGDVVTAHLRYSCERASREAGRAG